MDAYKSVSKGRKRPLNRSGGPVIGGQRRANAIDAMVESAQTGRRAGHSMDEVHEHQIVRR